MELKLPEFRDSPGPEQLIAAVGRWQQPDWRVETKILARDQRSGGFWETALLWRRKLEATLERSPRMKLEKELVDWLFTLIRLNVKRGRIFDLREVIETSRADCLGYAKVFTVLGRSCGLDLGVVEVIIDNRGLNVPHTATLVRLASSQPQFIDFWYGSQDIRHRRIGLSVKRNNLWKVMDIDYSYLSGVEEISYLPDSYVDGITLYIEGNRSLKKGDYAQAIEQYSQAAHLYPENARIYYNRAIALENIRQIEKAREDYARALRGEVAITRTLAVQPEDVVDLIQLDERKIPEAEQHIYLLNLGFITGKPLDAGEIAQQTGLPRERIMAILNSIKNNLENRAG